MTRILRITMEKNSFASRHFGKKYLWIARRYFFPSLPMLLLLFGAHYCDAARYAVIVGCNKGGSNVAALKYAENDARELTEILQTLGGFQPTNIRTLSGGDSALLWRSLASIDTLMKRDNDPNNLFLFYYSGHADAGHLMLGRQRYPISQLHGYLDSCAAAVKIGVFDACYSGGVTTFKGGKQIQPFYFEEQKAIEGQVIIASSAASEFAQESSTLKGSIFSHHLFNALRGSAAVSGSKQVTLNQAYQYAYRKTLETTALISGEIQHPVFKFDIHGQGDIVVTTLAKTSSSVLFDGTCEGNFLVLSDDYIDVFADFTKRRGFETTIALGPGTYRIINAVGKDISTHSFFLKNNETYPMNAGRLALTPPSLSRIKGPVMDTAQHPDKAGMPLSNHSWGGGARDMLFFSRNENPSFLGGLSYVNSWYIRNSIDLFLDVHWNFPGINALCLFGLDFYCKDRLAPFYAGMGAGPYYFEKTGATFRDRAGASFMCRGGYFADLNRQMQLRIQVPYTLFMGTKIANSIALEIVCIFFGPYRDVKVLHI